MRNSFKRYFWVVNVVAIVACAFFAASAVNHVLEARLGVALPAATAAVADADDVAEPAPVQQRRSKSGASLAARNMFCHECSPPEEAPVAAEPTVDPDNPPETGLPLRLVATHVTEPASSSLATVINTSSSVVGAYAVNGIIPEVGDVVAITGKYIHFRNRALLRVERLSLLPSSAPKTTAAPTTRREPPRGPRDSASAELDEGIRAVGDTQFEVDRALVNRMISNPTALRGARVVPQGNKGFRVYAVRPSSVAGRLGLRNGDTITAVNGYELSSLDSALEAYGKLRDATNLSLNVSRRGKPVTLSYIVK